ncbi:MAG: dynamin family protein, partial [Synergistaceae bacterium]|nr:dynamin family protein [Synergistaceae bacterium]
MRPDIQTEIRSSSAAFLRRFLAHAGGSVLDADFKTRRIFCSEPLVLSLRLTRETLPRTLEQWLELYHPDDYSKALEFRRRVAGEAGFQEAEGSFAEDAFSLERRLYCGDGVYRRFRLDAVCLRTPDGPERLIGLETEEGRNLAGNLEDRLAALERNARLLRRMLDASSDLIFHRDANGCLTLCNRAFADALASDPGLMESRFAEPGLEPGQSGAVDADAAEGSRVDAYGRKRRLVTRLCTLPDSEGQVGAASDTTERAEMEEDAARLRRLLALSVLRGRDREDEELALPVFPAPSAASEKPSETDAPLAGTLREALSRAEAAFSPVASLFPARAERLGLLIRSAGNPDLEAGVVGITSSGKSTLINAVMGERLLPEETRATTNLIVRCRKGSERAVTVTTKDGSRRVTGAELSAAWMEHLASERLNPGNEKGVSLLEWTSPGAALPEGLVLVDTPGIDACDFPDHSELLLRRLLPAFDIVLYVTSIRNRMKTADLEVLNAVLEQDQKAVFLLSQIDLERDDTEGGQVVLSRRRKLSGYVRELREDIRGVGGGALRDAAVIPVSSKLALTHFYDRGSEEWAASNFGTLIGRLEAFRGSLNRRGAETRTERAAAFLSRAAADLQAALLSAPGTEIFGEKSAESVAAGIGEAERRVQALRDARRWVEAEISTVRGEWRKLIDPETRVKALERELENASTIKGVKDRYERWGTEWPELTARMTARMDRARRACREVLEKHSVTPGNRVRAEPDMTSDLPAFHRYIRQEAKTIQVRGWFEDVRFWPRYETFFRQGIDMVGMLAGARKLIAERARLLNEHLSWWEEKMRADYHEPLGEEFAREEAALADLRAEAERPETERGERRDNLTQALAGIREAEGSIREALKKDPPLPGAPEETGDECFERFAGTEPEEESFFEPLLTVFRERDIQARFLRLDALKEMKDTRRVVFLGLRRHDSLYLLSRLAHDAAFSASLRTEDGREPGEREWIFCGSAPPDLPHVRVAAPDTLLSELEVLIAPGDALCEGSVDWNGLFAEWLPVIHLD